LKFVIKAIYSFEVRKSKGYCGSSHSRIFGESNQKWSMSKKNSFKGAKGF
jgi:hypothetical protein